MVGFHEDKTWKIHSLVVQCFYLKKMGPIKMYNTTCKHQSHSLRNADSVFIDFWFYTISVTFVDSRFLSISTALILKLHHAFNIYWGYLCGIGFLIFSLISRLYFTCSITIQGSGLTSMMDSLQFNAIQCAKFKHTGFCFWFLWEVYIIHINVVTIPLKKSYVKFD